jgi:hypothetical protein
LAKRLLEALKSRKNPSQQTGQNEDREQRSRKPGKKEGKASSSDFQGEQEGQNGDGEEKGEARRKTPSRSRNEQQGENRERARVQKGEGREGSKKGEHGKKDEDEAVPLDKLPKVVKDALKARYPEAEVVKAGKGDHDGTKVYEFELKQGKKTWEASFTPDGKFDSSEEIIEFSELPAAVKDALKQKHPKAKITKIEKETSGEGKNAKVIFEIVIEADGGMVEVQFDPSGKSIGSTEIKKKKS